MEIKVNTKYNIGDKVFIIVETAVFEGEIEDIDIYSTSFKDASKDFRIRYSIKGEISGKFGRRWGSNRAWRHQNDIYPARKEAEDAMVQNIISGLAGTLSNAVAHINNGIRYLKLKEMPDENSKILLEGLIAAKKMLIGTKKEAGVK